MTEIQLNNVRVDIANKIAQRRREMSLSQDKLAELTGMGIATIRRFESGKFWVNMKHYVILRSALDLPMEF